MPLHDAVPEMPDERELLLNPLFTRPGEVTCVPPLRLPDEPMNPDTGHLRVDDELMPDSQTTLDQVVAQYFALFRLAGRATAESSR